MNLQTFASKGQKAQAAVDAAIAEAEYKERHRQSRVINRDYVRRWALDYAKENRSHKFERVSEGFLNAIEAETKAAIIRKIERHPSKGKTLM